MERVQEDNTAAGFTPYARAIMAHLGEYYGCSAADLFTIVATYSPIALGAFGPDPAFDNQGLTSVFVRSSPLLSSAVHVPL